MKVLSLFSGVGGFDLGLEQAGMETVFQCEWDKHATKILEKHWPHVPRWDDVTTLTGQHILSHAPVIDVVAWGSPCQDLSVAGKRAGLQGARSGLFHEGVRIIKELRELTNGKYPRISIWENVAGALSSGAGADFGQVLYEMDEAGACFSEWRVLDAQYFGVPQRRRRVFLISVFDPATAARCPDPLLPVSEGVQWHPATGNTTRQTVTGETAASFGSGSYGGWTATDTAITLSARDHKGGNTVTVEPFTPSQFAQYTEGIGTLRFNGGDLAGGSETLAVYTKSKRPQSATDDETWVADQPNPTLNGFDQGDTRATTVIVGSLQARDYKGANHEGARDGKLVTEPVLLTMREGKPGGGKGPLLSTDKSLSLSTSNEQLLFQPTEDPIVFENSYRDAARIAQDGITQTLTSKMGTGGGNTPMVAFATNQRAEVRELDDKAVALSAEPGTNQQTYVAFPIQDGREMEKNQNGLGVAEEGAPAYTLDQTGAQAVAYGLQGNMIGRQDHNGPQGAGISQPGDPMFSLTSTDRHAVAQIAAGFKPGASADARTIGYEEELSPSLEAGGGGNNKPAVVIQYDGYNQKIHVDEPSVTLRIGRDSSDFVAQPVVFEPGAISRLEGERHSEKVSHTLRAEMGDNKPAVMTPTMAVRRLTPLECERLMGWPDNWTATKADGTPQSDTHRYKQCGNGVASPVAQWIAQQLLQLDNQ